MISVTYFICGIRVESPTTLVLALRGGAVTPTPSLWHRAQAGREETIAAHAGTWTLVLEPGDHVIRITHDEYGEGVWPGTTLTLSPAAILAAAPTNGGIVAWETALTGSDPKDPWPPPDLAMTLGDTSWFAKAFAGLDVVAPRGD